MTMVNQLAFFTLSYPLLRGQGLKGWYTYTEADLMFALCER